MKKLFAPLLLLAVAAPLSAQQSDWSWKKVLQPGQTVEVRGVIGTISATPASGKEVEIVARKSARRGNPDDVRIEVVEHADGVLVCAVYEPANPCEPEFQGQIRTRENDTRVEFEVRVPRGLNFEGKNIAGAVRVEGLSGRVRAGSVSGDVDVSTSGLASASSVSGDVRVRMGRADWRDRLSFSSVSGDIELEVPDDFNADVSFTTVSGGFESDFPITTRTGARIRRGGMRGTIGSGGRDLTFSTVSGSVTIRRAN